jgi:hypothetical protein
MPSQFRQPAVALELGLMRHAVMTVRLDTHRCLSCSRRLRAFFALKREQGFRWRQRIAAFAISPVAY